MTHDTHAPQLRIGQLAAALGLNPKTIRYYEEIGLLPAPQRSVTGYRLYTAADGERLRFIAKAKAIGLTLEEIREILVYKRNGEQPCRHVLSLLDRKLAAVDAQLQALGAFRQALLALRKAAGNTMAGDAAICGIIEQHETRQ